MTKVKKSQESKKCVIKQILEVNDYLNFLLNDETMLALQ